MNPTTNATSPTRRRFLVDSTLATSAVALGLCSLSAQTSKADLGAPRFPIIGFSKPFQKLNAAKTADLVAEVGWNGIECPVRAKGQIEPARAPDELPKFVEMLRRRKLEVYVVTTDITSIEQPHAMAVLRTMSKLGLKRLRLGSFKYAANRNPIDQLNEIAPKLRDIAAACKDLGLQAGYQNHSGRERVGAPVWDVFTIIRDFDPKHFGFCFDIGHATIEGGLSWPIEARLTEDFYTAVYVKDFYWQKEATGWKETWCNLGDGMVSRTFFDRLKVSNYRGPIAQHHEYPMGDTKQMVAHMRRDLKKLKEWLG